MIEKLKPYIYSLGARGLKALFYLVFRTCRFKVYGLDHFLKLSREESILLTFWHNRIALFAESFVSYVPDADGFVAVISASKDAKWLEAFIRLFPKTDVIRVRHNKRDQALKEMVHLLQNTKQCLLWTPDGPRGPKYRVKRGGLLAAQKTKAPILPFSWSGPHFSLPTWDGFWIPKPFSTFSVYIGKPIYLEETQDLDTAKQLVEKALNELSS